MCGGGRPRPLGRALVGHRAAARAPRGGSWATAAHALREAAGSPRRARGRLRGPRGGQVARWEPSPTHMEWFYGPKGLKFSEIGCRPPGVRAWDLYNVANDMDLYREWAMFVAAGRPSQRASRRFAAGIIALRPDRDGVISHYDGVDEVHRKLGGFFIDEYLPPPGTPTQPVEAGYMANAWMRLKHPDYDELRRMLDFIGQTAKVRAR